MKTPDALSGIALALLRFRFPLQDFDSSDITETVREVAPLVKATEGDTLAAAHDLHKRFCTIAGDGLRVTVSGSVECPHCHWGFAPAVIRQHIREKH
jgi:hypothetical protein